MIPTTTTLLAAMLLATVHLFAGKLRFLQGTPRSRWLSVAGGISVAYVFVHLLPELSAGQETLARRFDEIVGFAERHVYLISLVGLITFYGLERLAKSSRRQRAAVGSGDATEAKVFWIHIASFTVYNALIGYLLLHREAQTASSLVFYVFAMALHFVVTDFGLDQDHKHQYRHHGRWILTIAIFAGWIVGYLTEISEAAIAVLVAFLAGGVVLNVLKEELPEERESSFLAFLLGAASYAALLLIV
jgi:zinc transporter ZupT